MRRALGPGYSSDSPSHLGATTTRRLLATWASLTVVAALSACSTDVGDLGAISETTGAGGGTPDLPGGVALTVPAGALSGDVAIGSGCYQDAQAGHCTDNGRPLLPAGSDTDQATHDACADVAVYGCAP